MKFFGTILTIIFLAFGGFAFAVTWTVDDDKAQCLDANFTHPQDAVNAAAPYDIILVYPGTYSHKVFTTKPPHWTYPNDQLTPGLIVYKDGLVIQAVDPDPAKTIIQCDHDAWMNPVAIQAFTGGVWNGTKYVGAGVNPVGGSAPNAIAIIARNVTISGVTLRKPYHNNSGGFYNTAGVMIGGLFAGDPYNLGAGDNTITKCVFKDCWHAVYLWHSSDNSILNNTVEALGNTGHWAGISLYDGYNDAQINLGYTSQYNKIINNTLADKGIAIGAWAPAIWTDNAGTKVHGNSCTYIGATYSRGKKMFSGNIVTGYCWVTEASDYKFPGNSNHEPPESWSMKAELETVDRSAE
jgi:parallel beta-helix repeat protein